jgi:xylulose-5-phosphate/fructose-6-phosphate phosphoketolase
MDTLSEPVTATYTEHDRDLDLRWWAAANYLTVAQIYLKANPLVRDELSVEDIKPRLLGHWGTSPGLSMIYTLLNRLIRQTGADCIYVTGPGHGGPALLANVYLEGTYSEVYPHIGAGLDGLTALVRQFSTPGGCRATSACRCRAVSTRAASSGTRSRTPRAPRSTTRI